MANAIPTPGMVLAGKYRVDRVLGAGGMGVVLAVQHLELDKPLALKLLRPHVLQSASAVERFLREARAASAIESDHVARVVDFGRFANGWPYMAMELLAGEDLAQRLARVGSLSVTDAITMVLQACEALAEAHALGVVHRDLKPANIFLHYRRDGSETVKILDFGISKVAADAAAHLTNSAAVMGSPLYMSPEQLHNARTVDVRADIWAIGTILYEATQGRAPFAHAAESSLAELGIAITHDAPPPMVQVPSDFASIVTRCLAKPPAQRWPDVGSLAHALATLPGATLEHIASAQRIARTFAPPSSRPLSSQQAGQVYPRASTTGASSSDAGPAATRRPRRSRARWVVFAGGATMSSLVLAVVTLRHLPSPPADSVRMVTAHPASPASSEPMFMPMASPMQSGSGIPPSASAMPSAKESLPRPPVLPTPRVRVVPPSTSASPSLPSHPRGALGLGSLTE